MTNMKQRINEHIETCKKITDSESDIIKAAEIITNAYIKGGKLLICGNGGSAADAQHFAGELVGKFMKERKALPAIAITTNTSNMTAIGNDYEFEKIFEREVEALGKKGDVLFTISTSGNSENVIRAVKKANEIGMNAIALLGKGGGKLKGLCNCEIIVPSNDTQRVQEAHIMIIHLICELIEADL
ncbi:D-sedoheptulose 7-phosphate isomerase [Candidatus Micrarchaeota archaeon]|nr:D-sedoheptulose 7-phosphate isomerase [Candidatus Micrarchaeota archaeon]